MNDETTVIKERGVGSLVWALFGIATAIIGYHIHHSILWAIVDWMFSPIAWLKWMICQEVSITIIKEAFSFFLK
jgi:hypothetical protein